MSESSQAAGWYYAEGDPPGTQRYWDGSAWQGGPQAMPGPEAAGGFGGVGGAQPVASPSDRILGRFIDVAIAIALSLIAAVTIGGGQATAFSSDYSFRAALAGLIAGLVYAVYELYMTANGGQTVGKKAMSTKIVNVDGSDIDMTVAVRRFSPYLASTVAGIIPILGVIVGIVVFLIGLASFVMLFTDDRNQTVWDKIGPTLVVKS